MGGVLKRRGDRGGMCGAVLSLCLERQIDEEKKMTTEIRCGLRRLQYNSLTHNNQTKIRMRHREDEEEEIRGEGGKGTVIWYVQC